MVNVHLTCGELYAGALAGCLRQIENLSVDGAKPTRGLDTNELDWQMHVEGALKELAAAKHFGLYFGGKGQRGDKDFKEFEVRSTDKPHGRLLVRKTDSPDSFYILVTGLNGNYTVHGGMYGHEAMVDEYWDKKMKRPCWAVPQRDLREEK